MLARLKSLTKSERSIIGLGLALVLLFAVNIFSNVVLKPYQLDMTEGKLFTVSQGTKTIIKGIDEPIVLRLFFTKVMGEGNPAHTQLFVHVKELLERYASLSNGRIRLELYDAAPFSPAEDKAEAFGLTGIAYNEAGDLGYFGLVGTNSTDDVELVKAFTPDRERFLEYDISKLIYRLTNPEEEGHRVDQLDADRRRRGGSKPGRAAMANHRPRPRVIRYRAAAVLHRQDSRQYRRSLDRPSAQIRQFRALCHRPVRVERRARTGLRRPAVRVRARRSVRRSHPDDPIWTAC